MATTKFFLDMRGKAKDGKGSVLISIFHNKSTSTIPTGIRISPKEWTGEQVVGRDDAAILNARLSSKKSKIDNAIAVLSLAESFSRMTATDIKHNISEERESKDRKYLSVLFEEYTRTGLEEGTKEIYRTTLNKVLSFGGQKMKIDAVTVKWLYDFEEYLAKKQCVNGRAIYLRHLRAVCRYAYKTGACQHYPFDFFQIKLEPTMKKSIQVDTLRDFAQCPVTGAQDKYRDYFFLMFYLVGVNVTDLLTARPDSIRNGRFEYRRRKTHKFYSIKIEPEAQELIDKYRGKDYLLEAMDHIIYPKSFIKSMHRSLRSIGYVQDILVDTGGLFGKCELVQQIKPIIPDITSNFARHSWATFAHEVGISTDVIAMAMGHAPTNRTTFIYIKPDQSKIDEANRKVIDYFLGVGTLSSSM